MSETLPHRKDTRIRRTNTWHASRNEGQGVALIKFPVTGIIGVVAVYLMS